MLLLLFVFWVILNGKITLEITIFGIFLTIAIFFMMRILFDYTLLKELRLLKKVPIFIAYIYILIREIAIANMNVINVILQPDLKVEPTLVTFHTNIKTRFGKFMLANSITLTPGTITVSIKDDTFVVHCLTKDYLNISTFVEWIERMEAE